MRFALLIAISLFAFSDAYRKAWRQRKPKCDPVKCEEPCRESISENGCATCLCDPLCSPPKCDPGCEIQKEFDGPCPGCECEKEDEDLEKFSCQLSPPKCPPGCEIETEFDGPCPGCKCETEEMKDEKIPDLTKAMCDPVKCERPCRKIIGDNGCPICDCVQCIPPLCDEPGCRLIFVPDARCPTCSCNKDLDKDLPSKCDPVLCLPGCEMETIPGSCPTCVCKPICDPPKCEPGCVIKRLPGDECPGCVCEEEKFDDSVDKCPPEEECSKPGCSLRVDPNGCNTCMCRPICDPPRCPRWCRIEQGKGPEQCPTCVCSKKWNIGK